MLSSKYTDVPHEILTKQLVDYLENGQSVILFPLYENQFDTYGFEKFPTFTFDEWDDIYSNPKIYKVLTNTHSVHYLKCVLDAVNENRLDSTFGYLLGQEW